MKDGFSLRSYWEVPNPGPIILEYLQYLHHYADMLCVDNIGDTKDRMCSY